MSKTIRYEASDDYDTRQDKREAKRVRRNREAMRNSYALSVAVFTDRNGK